MYRRTVFAVAGWLVAAVAATVTGLAAVRVIGAGITGPVGEVVSEEAVSRSLAATPPAAPVPTTASAGPGGTSPTVAPTDGRVVSTPGGTVVARCVGEEVVLLSWAPAQGYGVKSVDQEPDDHVQVSFEGAAGEVEVELRCVAGRPVASWD